MTSIRSRMGTSRLGGVPTVLPPPGAAPGRPARARPRRRRPTRPRAPATCSPDVVHVAGWLDADAPARRSSPTSGGGPCRRPGCATRGCRPGHLMTVQSVCLGWHWQPVRLQPHGRRHRRRAGEAAARRPRRARPAGPSPTRSAPPAGDRYAPDAAIVNLYAPGARLGLHQDGEEPSDAPVVTISLGDTCVFRLAGVDRRTSPFTDVELRSRRPARVRRRQPAHLPRRAEGARRHRPGGLGLAARPAEHHRAGDRAVTPHGTVGAVGIMCRCARSSELVREHGAVVMRVCRALLAAGRRRGRLVGDVPGRAAGVPAAAARTATCAAWLVTIAHRKAIDQLRAARPPGRARPATLPDAGDRPIPSRADDELRAAVAALPPKQREAVVLHHLAGLPYAEVAAELGSTRGRGPPRRRRRHRRACARRDRPQEATP